MQEPQAATPYPFQGSVPPIQGTRPPIEHELKCFPDYFMEVWEGRKTFELRKNDRDFRQGDLIWLRAWNPTTQTYTTKELTRRAGYILYGGEFGLPVDMCIISLLEIDPWDSDGDDDEDEAWEEFDADA